MAQQSNIGPSVISIKILARLLSHTYYHIASFQGKCIFEGGSALNATFTTGDIPKYWSTVWMEPTRKKSKALPYYVIDLLLQ